MVSTPTRIETSCKTFRSVAMFAGLTYTTIGVGVGIALMIYKSEWILDKIVRVKAWVKDKFTDVSKF